MAGAVYSRADGKTIEAGPDSAQMGGFFRKELVTVDNLKGLKFRVAPNDWDNLHLPTFGSTHCSCALNIRLPVQTERLEFTRPMM